MDRKNLETDIIKQQVRYIRHLEEQLAVYKKKDKTQVLLRPAILDALFRVFLKNIPQLTLFPSKSRSRGDFPLLLLSVSYYRF